MLTDAAVFYIFVENCGFMQDFVQKKLCHFYSGARTRSDYFTEIHGDEVALLATSIKSVDIYHFQTLYFSVLQL